MKKLALILLPLAFLALGCAKVKVQKFRTDLKPLPRHESQAIRFAYYENHSIQEADGDQVKVGNRFYSDADPQNGLGFADSSGRPWVYVGDRNRGLKRASTLAIFPAGAAVGAAVGVVVDFFMLFGGWFVDVQPSQVVLEQNVKYGALLGAAVGLGGGITLFSLVPGLSKRSVKRAAQRYNNMLWGGLDLGIMPGDRETKIKLHVKF